MTIHTKFALAVAAASVLLAGAVTTTAQGQPAPATATVTVVHGLRGQLVDVYLDGELALKAFEPDRTTEPLQIPAGTHRVDLRPAKAAASSKPFATATVDLAAGSNQSVVAHFAPGGKRTISRFMNNTAPLTAGTARLVARNTAEVVPVDLVVDGNAIKRDLKTSQEFSAELAPASHKITLQDQDGETIVPPDDVPVAEGAATIMYLVGSQPDRNLIWIAQAIPGLQSAPSAVATGNSGLLPAPSGSDRTLARPLVAVTAGGSLLLALVATGLVRRRRSA